MTNKKRIQRKRTKGWKMPENTVYVLVAMDVDRGRLSVCYV